MPNNRKPAANTPRSTKENTQPRSSAATRPTSVLKPPQRQASSSNGAKDTETAALLAVLRAEIDQLKKLQAAKPKESDAEEIPRPAKMTSLQAAMGLTENKKLYSYCRSVIRDVISHAGLPTNIDWRSQDAVAIGKIAQVATTRCKQLRRYKGNWATLEIMKTLLKNRRAYKTRIGPLDELDDQDMKKEVDGEERVSEKEDDNDWEAMYMKDKTENYGEDREDLDARDKDENINGGGDDDEDEDGNGGEGRGRGADKREHEHDEDEDGNGGEGGGWGADKREHEHDEDEYGNGGEGGGGVDEYGDEHGGGDERTDRNDSRMKRKASQDEPGTTTRGKKKKTNDSGAATQLMKKALPKKKPGKKKN